MTTNRYRRPDRAATVQAALCRLEMAERERGPPACCTLFGFL